MIPGLEGPPSSAAHTARTFPLYRTATSSATVQT